MSTHDYVKIADVAKLMRVVQADCEVDAHNLETTPFTAEGVAKVLGELLAEISACARCIELLALELLP